MNSVAASVADDTSAPQADAYPHASKFDSVGIAASLACAIHCLVAPFLLLLLPAAGSIWAHPAVHWILAALVLPLALVVVFRGYRLHRRRSAVAAAVLGAGFIVAGLLPGMSTRFPAATLPLDGAPSFVQSLLPAGAAAETCTETCCPSIATDSQTGSTNLTIPPASLVTIIGSVLLITAHGINLYGCHCFRRKQDPEGNSCGCPVAC